ncbi:transposable element Tcb2 transposase [Trichonephila clavipes]|nr:transposable element Tcb2 transposase [Trichonephila clavipes]
MSYDDSACKNPLRCRLGCQNSKVQFCTVRAQVPPSEEETGHQIYLRQLIPPIIRCRTEKLHQLLGNKLDLQRNRRQTAGEIARHTAQATGRPISRFTVARRLHGGGLFARRPARCVPLTPAHRRKRSLWCREHRNWRDNEWGRVLFTDESRFSLSSDSHRILIWRERKKPQSSIEHH